LLKEGRSEVEASLNQDHYGSRERRDPNDELHKALLPHHNALFSASECQLAQVVEAALGKRTFVPDPLF